MDNCNSRVSRIFRTPPPQILENFEEFRVSTTFWRVLERLAFLERKLDTSREKHFRKQKICRVLESSTYYSGGFFSGEFQRELFSPRFGENPFCKTCDFTDFQRTSVSMF